MSDKIIFIVGGIMCLGFGWLWYQDRQPAPQPLADITVGSYATMNPPPDSDKPGSPRFLGCRGSKDRNRLAEIEAMGEYEFGQAVMHHEAVNFYARAVIVKEKSDDMVRVQGSPPDGPEYWIYRRCLRALTSEEWKQVQK